MKMWEGWVSKNDFVFGFMFVSSCGKWGGKDERHAAAEISREFGGDGGVYHVRS